MRINETPILSAGDMSTASLTSAVINCEVKILSAVSAVWTGSPVGSLVLQASIDQSQWNTIGGSTQSVSGAGSVLYNIEDMGFPYMRAVYTKTSGTGSLTIKVNLKGPS